MNFTHGGIKIEADVFGEFHEDQVCDSGRFEGQREGQKWDVVSQFIHR